jgi:hypothetical protein
MKKLLLLPVFILMLQCAFAQFGITGGYRFNDAPDWQVTALDGRTLPALGDGYSIGLDYWFRLKNYRLEFLPEANFSTFEENSSAFNTNLNAFSFFANVNFYPLDFFGDCDCPTWSKQGDFFKKGFFVQVSPGVSYFRQEIQMGEIFNDNATAFSLGGGVGFDIGITDLVTFSPMAGVRYYFSSPWDGLADASAETELQTPHSTITQFFAGARVGFRLDYR